MTDAYELEELITIRDWEMDDDVTDDPVEWFNQMVEDLASEELTGALKARVADNVDRDAPEDWNCAPGALDSILPEDVVDDAVMSELDSAGVFEAFVDHADQHEFEDAESMREEVRDHAVGVVEDELQVYDEALGEKDKPEYQQVLDDLNDAQNALEQGEDFDVKTLEYHKERLVDALQDVSESTRDTVLNQACGLVDEWNKTPIKKELKPKQDDKKGGNSKRKGKKQDRVNIVENAVHMDVMESWLSKSNDVYVRINLDEHDKQDDGDDDEDEDDEEESSSRTVMKVSPDKGTPFYVYVAHKWRKITGDVPKESDIKQVVQGIGHHRMHQANMGNIPERKMTSQMYAERPDGFDGGETFYYYAGDTEDIVVNGLGVSYKDSSGHFRISESLAPYEYDEDHDDITIRDAIDDVLSLDAKQRYLFAPMIPAYFVPDANKPITHFRGPSGSGKSHTSKFLKMVLSPEERRLDSPLKQGDGLPNDESDLKTNCLHTNTILVDNEKHISGDKQDLMCSIVTGSTFKKRSLFTDDKQVSYELHNHFIVNYISLNYMQDDFANRSIIFDLDRINRRDRLKDEEWRRRAKSLYSDVQSKSFEVLSQALSMTREERDALPRAPGMHMNDFYQWCIRCASVMGYDVEKYAESLRDFKEKSEMASIQDSDFTGQIIEYVHTSDSPVEGRAADIYQEFKDNFEYTNTKEFPNNPATMGKRLSNRTKDRLEKGANITVKKETRRGHRYYTIYHRGKHAHLVTDNLEERDVWNAVDRLDDGQGAPTQDVINQLIDDKEVDEETVEERLDDMRDKGDIFEVEPGRIKTL